MIMLVYIITNLNVTMIHSMLVKQIATLKLVVMSTPFKLS